MKAGILGLGEVGSAVAMLYGNPLIKDIDTDTFEKGMDFLHVCIPYSDSFVKIVKGVISEYEPRNTIIHSTVKIGTTLEIGGNTVHSPMRGVHPNLFEGLTTFVKYIGCDKFTKSACDIAFHFIELGLHARLVLGSRNTEAGKLWSTTQYGLNIAIEKHIHKFCEDNGLDFSVVYTNFNRTYNDGYRELGLDHYCKYVLEHRDGEIGGHCVLPNVELLDDNFVNRFMLTQEGDVDAACLQLK